MFSTFLLSKKYGFGLNYLPYLQATGGTKDFSVLVEHQTITRSRNGESTDRLNQYGQIS